MIVLDKDKLKELYVDQKLSQAQIAQQLNCSIDIVGRYIKKYDLRKVKNIPTKEELKELYINQHKTQREIGMIYGIDHKTIYNYIKKWNIDENNERTRIIQQVHSSSRKIDNISYNTIYKLYIEDNLSRAEVSQKLNICVNLVDDLLSKYEIKKSKDLISKQKKNTNVKHFGETAYTKTQDYKNTVKKAYVQQYLNIGVPEELISIYADDELFKQYIYDNCKQKTISDIAQEFHLGYSTIAIRLQKLDLHKDIDFFKPTYTYEKELETFLKENNIKFIEHDRSILNGKEIDIYCPDYKIGIEFNGSYWHSELKRDRLYHQEKSKLAEEKGVFIYHIFEYEWLSKKEKIQSQLCNLFKLNKLKIYARTCDIKIVDKNTKTDFINQNHIQGSSPSSIDLGLYYEDQLVSIMTFGKTRFDKINNWELIRFCSLTDYNIIGGASKLFTYFTKNYMQPGESCVSYSDYAKTRGALYETLNFEYIHLSAPSYVWWYNNDDILTRYQTQIKKERENLQSKGYVRIYDCGTKVWVYRKR